MANLNKFRSHPLYRIFLWGILAASLAVLWKMNTTVLSNPVYIPVDDFSHYWAAGRFAMAGNNPYDPNLVQQLRDSIIGSRSSYDTIPIMWTPPWSLPFVMPFGVLSYPTARLLWLLAHITLLLVCTNLTWKIYRGIPKMVVVAYVMTFIFGPTISVLEKGQITPWVLMGITGFLYFCEYKKNDLLAGMSVLLIALKPQLFYLFWPALLMWVITKRKWQLAASALIITGAAVIFPCLFNPALPGQYIQAVLNYPPVDWATPTIGGYLRLLFGTELFWLQFFPPILGLIWFIYYWGRHRSDWTWSKVLPGLLLVSILTAPYAWTYDQVILVPAMLMAGVRLMQYPNEQRTRLFGGAFIGISLLDLILHRFYDEFWFGWLAPILLFWFYAVMLKLPEKGDLTNRDHDYETT